MCLHVLVVSTSACISDVSSFVTAATMRYYPNRECLHFCFCSFLTGADSDSISEQLHIVAWPGQFCNERDHHLSCQKHIRYMVNALQIFIIRRLG